MSKTSGAWRLLVGIPRLVLLLPVAAAVVLVAIGVYRGGSAVKQVQEVLWENNQLKQAITNLTDAGKIGYAKVLSQTLGPDGQVAETTLKFVETARDDEFKKVLEKEYTIEGDIIHFDALVVKFGDKMVMDGQKKSLFLWRRVYGEMMPPAEGFPIEEPGGPPRRYESLLAELPLGQQQDFWDGIWQLANDPDKLRSYDIEAIYGNVTYQKLRPGRVYIFRISATGQVYPEVILEI
ncbi:MAG: hypothetical protein JW709_11955 [Sedimentisphaerales bacterium]|nr:hypothetical protein [Sedimentisphaerales bacterium]